MSLVMKMSRCAIKNCKNDGIIIYYGRQICEKHWLKHCNENDKFNLKDELRIKS